MSSVHNLKNFFKIRKEIKQRKEMELIKEGKALIFNEFLDFIKMSNVKGIVNLPKLEGSTVLHIPDLFKKKLLYFEFCVQIISVIDFCHKKNLSLEKYIHFENIIHNVIYKL